MNMFFVRHGQASFGSADYDRLSPTGLNQAKVLAGHFINKGMLWDEIYVGELQRQIHTLDIICREYETSGYVLPARASDKVLNEFHGPRVLASIMPLLIERDSKVRDLSSAMAADPDKFLDYSLDIFGHVMEEWADGKLQDIHPPQYDDWSSFHYNAEKWLMDKLNNYEEKKGKNILVVTSGGTISSMIGVVNNMKSPREIVRNVRPIMNTSVTEIAITNNKLSLIRFNDVGHLDKSLQTYV